MKLIYDSSGTFMQLSRDVFSETDICREHDHGGWLGSRVVSVLDSGAEGLGSNRSRDAVG